MFHQGEIVLNVAFPLNGRVLRRRPTFITGSPVVEIAQVPLPAAILELGTDFDSIGNLVMCAARPQIRKIRWTSGPSEDVAWS